MHARNPPHQSEGLLIRRGRDGHPEVSVADAADALGDELGLACAGGGGDDGAGAAHGCEEVANRLVSNPHGVLHYAAVKECPGRCGCAAHDRLYSPRDKLRPWTAIVRVVERWPNRSGSHARIWPCHASLSPRTTCRPSPSSAITTPSRSSSASSKSSSSSPRVWPTTTSPASLAPPAPPSSATSARS